MKTKDIIEGLLILEKYHDDPDGYNVVAEHAMIYAYPTDKPVEQPDLDRLIALGWHQNADVGDEGEFAAKHYDFNESWYCYT